MTPPDSAVTALPATTVENKFTVHWGGSDARSGLCWYDIQVRDGNRSDSAWEDWLVNTDTTAALFAGQPGHTYYFRSRAMDEIGNWEPWPTLADGDTHTRIDPSSAPPVVWWNDDYDEKRNLIILNNDTDTMPTGFPVHVRFDASTDPTAAEIYAASLSATKGDDIRIVHNNQTQLDRVIYTMQSNQIDIWFPIQAGLGGGQTDSTNYQIYYGNASASSPPANSNNVFLPHADGNTMGLWHFQEGSGSTVKTSGRSHNGSFLSTVVG